MFRVSIIANILKKSILFLGSTVPLIFVTRLALAADSEDLLAGLMPSVSSTFGSDSFIWKILLLAEFATSILLWIKTKKFEVFIGVIVLSLFINFALKKFVGI